MKIGIIGSGNVGQQLGLGFIKLGHEVKIGTRDVSKLSDWEKTAGEKGSAVSLKDAAEFGEIIVLATSWSGTENAINLAGKENFKNKILIDVTNPLDFLNGTPGLAVSFGNSGGEQIQKWLPEAKVVKAFNIINAYTMCNPKREEGVPDLFIAGNDKNAKDIVSKFAKEWGWGSVIDTGDITQAYWLEALAMIWINYAFKFKQSSHAFKLLRK